MVTSFPRRSDSLPAPGLHGAGEPLLSIAAAERETGLAKETLRAWERRYGFPLPERDAAGVRGYSRALVDRLCRIRGAILQGHRPGRLLALPAHELDALLATLAEPATDRPGPCEPGALPLADCLAALRAGGVGTLRHWLARGLARMGLAAFVVEGLAPLNDAIGRAWLAGRVAVYEEHLYSEAVQSLMRNALLPFQAGLDASGPRVLLTTLPGEEHGLGLLMAEALMTLEACACLPLGVQTPVADIAAAMRAHRVDVVALSFTDSLPEAGAVAALAELRALLPAQAAIWVGGAAAARRGAVPGVRVLGGLDAIGPAVAAWRRDFQRDSELTANPQGD